jgi:diguanylate cyclase (GGDEF)-like protein
MRFFVKTIIDFLGKLISSITSTVHWENYYVLGGEVLKTLEKLVDYLKILTGLDNLYVSKNTSYNNSNCKKIKLQSSDYDLYVTGSASDQVVLNIVRVLNLFLEEKDENLRILQTSRHFENLAKTDSLTKLSNLRDLKGRFSQAMLEFRQTKRSFSLIIGDVDYFKAINDLHGHRCGDEVLRRSAAIFRSAFRDEDVVSRYGGDEFVVFQFGVDLMESRSFVDNVKQAIEQEAFVFKKDVFHITMSFGLSNFCTELSFTECFEQTDKALYDAKEKGRKMITCNNSLQNLPIDVKP